LEKTLNSDISEFPKRKLEVLGWSPFFQEHYQKLNIADIVPARVTAETKNSFQVYSEYGELTAVIAGKMRFDDGADSLYPSVGDWVAIKPLVGEKKAVIQVVLPRRSKFSRKVAGESTKEQIVSCNIDTVFIVCGLDGGRSFNLRRIERYLTLAWSSGATPVVILNKSDLCPNVEELVKSVEEIAPGVAVHAVSARLRTGLEPLRDYLTKGKTGAFLGSSGAGKSALINALLGEERQATGEIRQDDRTGRHTTTRRELIVLPGGGIVIDTPGMREIQMWAGEEDLQGTFSDIEELAKGCRFKDCRHNAESGCCVRAAVDEGSLDSGRLESYQKLQKELVYLAAREEGSTRQYEKMRFKKIAKWSKELNKRDQ
jgi:ribosome biogenesis GTPase / thiamine phosphate phosphatase